MAGSQPRESGESTEGLKGLVDAICHLIQQIPGDNTPVEVKTDNGTRTVTVDKSPDDDDGKDSSFTQRDVAYKYIVHVKNDGVEVLRIVWKQAHVGIRDGATEKTVYKNDELTILSLGVLSGGNNLILVSKGNELGLQPKLTEQDIKLIADFLAKAVTQHGERERAQAEALDKTMSESAKEVRKVLINL